MLISNKQLSTWISLHLLKDSKRILKQSSLFYQPRSYYVLNNHTIYIPTFHTQVHTVKYLYMLLDSKCKFYSPNQ